MLWRELDPEPGIVSALDHAGGRVEQGSQNEKRAWSERFANGCAVALATEFRGIERLAQRKILPQGLATGTEPLTPLGSGTSKRIDVTVVDPILGLEIGASLKGLNFRDASSGNFDKNLTGRLYELADEVRLVHEHLPHAFMVGVFFLPLESCMDKSPSAASSFAKTVLKLRERTGRLDPAIAAHAPRCDMGFVGLYSHGEGELGVNRGVVRFLQVQSPPPRRGRPRVEDTVSLAGLVQTAVSAATYSEQESWSEPEDAGGSA